MVNVGVSMAVRNGHGDWGRVTELQSCVCVDVDLHLSVSACDKSGPWVSWGVVCEDGGERSGEAGACLTKAICMSCQRMWTVCG